MFEFFLIIIVKLTATFSTDINTIIENEKKIIFNEPNKKDEIIDFISTSQDDECTLNKIARKILFQINGNPTIILPVIDSSKDLGINYGIMPIFAIRDKKKEENISSVVAPSLNYNKHLGFTYTYRHYIFPSEKSLAVSRISLSQNSQQEVFLRYWEPEFMKTKTRINIEFRNWHNPKSSFYGYGPDSKKSKRANYTYYLKGGEISLSLPVSNFFYLDITPSYYLHKIRNGVVDEYKFSQIYPYEYFETSKEKKFFTNRFSLIFDTTDHPILPRIGSYIIISFTRSLKNLISDYTYSIYSFEIKDYYNYKDKYITAVRFLLEWKTGEKIPFYRMPQLGESTGLRMAGDGRFVDNVKMVLNIEQRLTVIRRPILKFLTELELTPFIDIGTVSSSINKLSLKKLKLGPGFATRIVLRPQIVATADLAYGSEGFNAIIKVNYPF